MTEGPDVAGNALPPSQNPRRRDETEVEAARRVLVREAVQTRQTVVTAIAIATLLILAALGYQRCSDPWWRCKRLADKESGPKGLTNEELATWDKLECSEWPGI